MFDSAIHPNPEKGQVVISDETLFSDAVTMFAAGMDTTAHTLVVATWQVLNHADVLKRLKDELRQAMPKPTDTLDWASLENLPYLVRNPSPASINRVLLTSIPHPSEL